MIMIPVTDIDITNLKKQLMLINKYKIINASNILQLTRQAMELASNFQHLSGQYKKELVLDTINSIIEDLEIEDLSEKDLGSNTIDFDKIKFVLNEVGPPVIDDLISAFKGNFRFKKTRRKYCFCIP